MSSVLAQGARMNPRSGGQNSTIVAQQAEVWLGKLERTLRRDETQALRTWLETPLHRQVMIDQCKIWHGPDILAVLSTLVPVRKRPQTSTDWQTRIVLGVLMAFSGLGFFLAIWRMWIAPSATASLRVMTEYRAEADARRKIDLPDGTTLELDSSSRIGVQYGAQSRDVRILRGEVLFDVASDPNRTLRISVGPRVLHVDSASRFNVRQRPTGEIELAVVSGRVHALDSRGTLTPAQIRARADRGARTFEAMEAGLLGAGWQLAWRMQGDELQRRLSWRDEVIEFENETLEDAPL